MRIVAAIFLTCFVFATVNAFAYPVQKPSSSLATMAVTISSGTTTSAALDLRGYTIVGIRFPATLTSTTISYTASETLGGTYVPVYNTSGALSYTIAQARYYSLPSADTSGVQYIKLVTGSSEGADRVITLMLRAL